MIPKIISSIGVKNPEKLLTDEKAEFEKDWGKGTPELVLEVNGYVEKISYIDGNGIDYCTVSYFDGEWKELIKLYLDKWQVKKEFEVNREISKVKFSGNLLPKYIEFFGKEIEITPNEINETDVITFSGATGSYVENVNNFVITLDKKPKRFSVERPEVPVTPDPTSEEILPVGKYISYRKKHQGMAGYNVRLPLDYYTSRNTFPLIIGLHGNGEKSANISLESLANRYPAKALPINVICITPQAEYTFYDDGHDNLKAMKVMIDEAIKGLRVDLKRVYITGLSDGGMGTWDFVALFPEFIAAAVPICGASRADICRAKDVPIWAFHNQNDPTVGVGGTLQAVSNLEACGSTVVQKTIYPVWGHDAWTKAYNDPEVLKWLLSQSK